MLRRAHVLIVLLALGTLPGAQEKSADFLDGFRGPEDSARTSKIIATPSQFNGYTNYWHSDYWEWRQYGNLFLLSHPDVEKTIAQNKLDTAEEIGIPGLLMEEGFLAGLFAAPYIKLENPTLAEVETKLAESNLLVYSAPSSELGRRLIHKIPVEADWRPALRSHQLNAGDFQDVRAFCLTKGERRIHVVLSDPGAGRSRLRELIGRTCAVLEQYNLHRGWFGTGTLLHSVTCQPGHPLEVIASGLNQGNDWFTFSGYMDYLLQPSSRSGWARSISTSSPTSAPARPPTASAPSPTAAAAGTA